MKTLHTADWHLGQKFYHKNRQEEHQYALDWLLETIIAQEIELLIIAGDIFDTDSPPNYARKMYFNFLKKLIKTSCQNVVVVAGNHDSANMLDASKELLELLNVYIVGHITKDRKNQIVEIRNETDELKAVIGAVPYLRVKDIRQNMAGETIEEREQAIKLGIQKHYQEIETELVPYQDKNIPVIVTGHLFASGGLRGERANRIHIGSLDVIEADNFSTDFDYIALGHLHRVQQIDKENNRPIWYSGSLIPLDFSELNYSQSVILIEFEDRIIKRRKSIQVDLKRKLRHYKGSLEYIKDKLENLDLEVALPTWIKIEADTEHFIPELYTELTAIIVDKPAEILDLKQQNNTHKNSLATQEKIIHLQDLKTIEVFEKCAQQNGELDPTEWKELKASFNELLNWMEEQDLE